MGEVVTNLRLQAHACFQVHLIIWSYTVVLKNGAKTIDHVHIDESYGAQEALVSSPLQLVASVEQSPGSPWNRHAVLPKLQHALLDVPSVVAN